MSTHNVPTTSRIQKTQARRGGVLFLAASALLGAALLAATPSHAHAQAALGVPFIGNNHLSFYSTQLTTDGIGTSTSTLYGGRYGHRFGGSDAQSRIAFNVQAAARTLSAPNDGVADVSLSTAWMRRIDEISSRLSTAVSVGASALAWGAADTDAGIARFSFPLTAGVSYDVPIGGATLSPFVAPGIAYYDARSYDDTGDRVASSSGWDSRLTSGLSLRLREVVLTSARIRGEHGLPNSSRWAFSAGISF